MSQTETTDAEDLGESMQKLLAELERLAQSAGAIATLSRDFQARATTMAARSGATTASARRDGYQHKAIEAPAPVARRNVERKVETS